MLAVPEQRADAEHVAQPLADGGVVEQLAEGAGQRQHHCPRPEHGQRHLRRAGARIDPPGGAKEHPVGAHRLQHARAAGHRDRTVAEGGTGDADRDHGGAVLAEQAAQQVCRRRVAGGEAGVPQAREIGVIGQQVADHHAGHAHAQRARQRALRIAHFAGQVVEVVEPAVGKQHRQQRTGERPRRSRRGRPADQRHAQMFMRQHQAGDHQQCNRQQLEHGEHVLQPRAGADTEQVDAHDEHDRAHRHRLHERRPGQP